MSLVQHGGSAGLGTDSLYLLFALTIITNLTILDLLRLLLIRLVSQIVGTVLGHVTDDEPGEGNLETHDGNDRDDGVRAERAVTRDTVRDGLADGFPHAEDTTVPVCQPSARRARGVFDGGKWVKLTLHSIAHQWQSTRGASKRTDPVSETRNGQ